MPARRAMSSVDAPWRPLSANSTRAASRISSRRSSFVFRSVTSTMCWMLVTTHNLVKRLGHDVEIGLGEPRVERQGERALEHPGRPREVALVAVGAEQVERVGADLRLDPLAAQLGEHAVA